MADYERTQGPQIKFYNEAGTARYINDKIVASGAGSTVAQMDATGDDEAMYTVASSTAGASAPVPSDAASHQE